MSKFIKKFENFSADLTGKAEKTIHDVDAGDEEGKEMTLDQFRKCHNYTLSGEWDGREDEKEFDSRQKDLDKYKNLSDTEKNKYLTNLEVSDDTVLESSEIDFSEPEISDVRDFIENYIGINNMEYNIRKGENSITLYGFSNTKHSVKFKKSLDDKKIKYEYQESIGSRYPYQIIVRKDMKHLKRFNENWKDILKKNFIIDTYKKIKLYMKNGGVGDLDLQDTKITSLPNGLKVGGYLDLRGTKITSLPDGLKVGGKIFKDF